jgi:hypothetical protein
MSQILCITIEQEGTRDLPFFTSYNLLKRKFALMRCNTDSLQRTVNILLPIKPHSVEHAIRHAASTDWKQKMANTSVYINWDKGATDN